MPKPFDELHERLLQAGIAPRYVHRYLSELADHLADMRAEEERSGRSRAEAECAALIRLGGIDELARAMIDQPQFQSWSARVPWATFGLAPLLLLAGAYVVALFILWSGWKMFLPGADTPFVRIHGFAILYFGFGKLVYFGAPILIGWGVVLMAARQRFKYVWPILGLVLIALISGTIQVHASRSAVPGGFGHISMDLTFWPPSPGVPYGLLHGIVIFTLTVLPYLIWRLQKAPSS